jgi:hypothetical protein
MPPRDRASLARLAGGRAAAILADPNATVVVAGQQPAAGGGPLYTLVKAAQAVALARRMAAAGQPAVAWFWCASEDHDLGEANHADLLRRDGSIQRVVCDLGPGRAALRWRPAQAWWEAVVAGCRASASGNLGADWLLQRRPVDNEGMGAWLCRLLRDLFPADPFVACEAHLLRPLWADALPDLHARWPRAALAARRDELLAAGENDHFGPLPDPPLFRDTPEGRVPLADLAGVPVAEISPGAALRPILQQLALPCTAAILGPGERAYHAAIMPVYAALGATPPRFVPRTSVTLEPAWIRRAAARLQLDVGALSAGGPLPPIPAATPPRLAALEQAIADLGDPADRRIAAAQARLRREAARLRGSLRRGERAAEGLPASGTIQAWLRPRSGPQDRTLSVFQAIWEHGPGLAGRLVEVLEEGVPAVTVHLG